MTVMVKTFGQSKLKVKINSFFFSFLFLSFPFFLMFEVEVSLYSYMCYFLGIGFSDKSGYGRGTERATTCR